MYSAIDSILSNMFFSSLIVGYNPYSVAYCYMFTRLPLLVQETGERVLNLRSGN